MSEEKTRLLLAEDDENLGSLLREYLQAKSYDTHWLTDGEKAYNSFKKNKYEICILDIMMPKMDGIELLKAIRKIDSDIAVIIFTAYPRAAIAIQVAPRGTGTPRFIVQTC